MSIHRIYRLYDLATREQRNAGRVWYDTARDTCDELANEYDVRFDIVAGVIAALSPENRWEKNVDDTRALFACIARGDSPDEYTFGAYRANVGKAWLIIKESRVFPHLNGPKVVAFYLNICGDYGVFTADSHIKNAYLGRRGSKAELKRMSLSRKISRDYRRAAQVKGERVCDFQAIVWLVWIDRISKGLCPGYRTYKRR
jgi:hypothetical protein